MTGATTRRGFVPLTETAAPSSAQVERRGFTPLTNAAPETPPPEARDARPVRHADGSVTGRIGDRGPVRVEPRTERTWGEVAADTGAQLAEGVNTLAGAVPNLVAPESGVARFFGDNASWWRAQQSEPLRQRMAAADEAIDAAGDDGMVSQIAQAAREYFHDPGLAARFVVTNLPSLIPGVGAAKIAQGAALARGASAAAAAGAATTAAGGVNAVLNAGGARGEAFEDIRSTLVRQGLSPEEAERQALKDSRVVAAVGAATGFLSGKIGLEGALVGRPAAGAALRAGARSTAAELIGEQIEEVAPKVTTNIQAGRHDGRRLTDDVGRTIVETAIGSAPGAGVAGALTVTRGRGFTPIGQSSASEVVDLAERRGFTPLDEPTAEDAPGRQLDPRTELGPTVVQALGVPTSAGTEAGGGAFAAELAQAGQAVASVPGWSVEQGVEQLRAAGELTPEGEAVLNLLHEGDPDRIAEFGARVDEALRAEGPRAGRFALMEADDLQGPVDAYGRENAAYPGSLLREGWRANDARQRAQAIVSEFDPVRLGYGVDEDDGAPVVASDGVVEVGHARALALRRVYAANGAKAQAYRQTVRDQAEALGIDPAAIDRMRKPVLVRVPDEPAARAQVAAQTPSATDPGSAEAGRSFGASASPGGNSVGTAPPSRDPGAPERPMSADPVPAGATQYSRGAMMPGAAYQGFIDDSGQADRAPRRETPIRREDILIPLAKALGTSLYEGRVKGKGVRGFFRPKTEEVRVRRHADLEASAHELAHLLDSRIPEIAQSWRKGPQARVFSNELRSLSYDASKVDEGFAEFVRHWMTQPDIAATRAPNFSAWWEDLVTRHEHGPAIRTAREGMVAWFNQSAIDRARSKIGEHDPMTKAMDDYWDRFRQSATDDLHGIYRMERELTGGIAPGGAYESARLTRAAASIADGALRFGAPVLKADGSFGWTGKGLEDILRPVSENLEDTLLYFVARSARELQTQGRENLFTVGEIDAMLKLRTPERDQAFREYQAWNSAVLDFAEAHGVINPQSRRLWRRMEYLPFHRVNKPGSTGSQSGRPGDWSGVKALTGGTENLRDVLGNMVGNAATLIDKAVKNEARRRIVALTEQHKGGRFLVKIPPESRKIRVDREAAVRELKKLMALDAAGKRGAKLSADIDKMLADAPGLLEIFQHGQPPGGANVVAVLQEGRPSWYEVGDPILMRSLESIDRKAMPAVVRWLGLPKRVGQTTIVFTPDFMVANLARDTVMGAVMSRAGFRPVLDSLQGMRLRMTNDPLYQDFIANGGGLSSIYLDEDKFRAKLGRFYARRGIDARMVLDTPAKLMGFVETVADAFEMSTRLGEYRRAVEAGEHPRHAAYLAREVSTDFAMRGDSQALGFFYDTVMFLRPAVLSFDRLARGLVHDPDRRAIAARAGMVALVSAALFLMNREDPRYQALPDWDRDAYWHFYIGDQHFRYPKIWEIGALGSAAERTLERMLSGEPTELAKDFARLLGTTFGLNFMPQLVAPFYEQATNRNSFTKAPIETPGMEDLQPFLRAKPTTSETMKAVGMATRDLPEALQVNPARTEALLRGFFNTWAMYGLMLTDRAFFGDQIPEARTDQLPVVRRFYSQEPPIRTKYETQFYDMLNEARRLSGTLRELDRQGRQDVANEVEQPLANQVKPLQRAAKTLSTINAEMREVRRDASLTPREKRERLDALTVERNALIKQTVTETKDSLEEAR